MIPSWWTWRFFKCTSWSNCLLGYHIDFEARIVADVSHAKKGDAISALSLLGVFSQGLRRSGGCISGVCCAAFVAVLRWCLLMLRACWVGFAHVHACALVVFFVLLVS